jgi:hypothetical protein
VDQVVQGAPEAVGPSISGSQAIVFAPPGWCGVARILCAGDMETPFLSGEYP